MNLAILFFAVLVVGALLAGLGYLIGRATAKASAQPPASAPAAPPEQASPGPPLAEGLQVTTDPAQGHRLVVGIDGALYLRYDAMSAEHRRRLRTYLMQVRDWMESTRGDLPLEPARAKPSTAPQELRVQRNAAKAQDMVAGIDAILQGKLKAAGVRAAVKIMRDWRGTGAVILVNGVRYDAVAEIPDETVRQLLREAAQEWESLQRKKKPFPKG